MSNGRKKVLFLVTKSNWGGAQRYVFDMATNLPQHDFEAVVAAGGTGEPGSSGGVLFNKLKETHIRTIHIPELGRDMKAGADFASAKAISALLKKERPDIVHLNSPKAGGIGSLVARWYRVPRIIYTAHGWPFWENTSAISKGLRFLFSYLTLLLVHKVICISRHDAFPFRFLPFGRSKISVVANGITPPTFLPREESRATLFTPEEIAGHERDAWVVTIAELNPNKNIQTALLAVAEYNKTHTRRIYYSIIGHGEKLAKLRTQTKTLGISNYVKFHGFVDSASSHLKAFHVFLLPSQKEGVPYVLLEAQAAGLPIVATRVGGIPEMKIPRMGTLVLPHDVCALALELERANCSVPEKTPLLPKTARAMVKDTLQVY